MSEVVQEAVVARPRGPLRRHVREHHGYRQRGIAPAEHRGLPSPYLTMIVTLDEPLVVARHADPAQSPGTYDAMVGGLHCSPALVVHDGAQSGIQLQVSPLASRALFGLPAGELAHVDIDLADVLGPLAKELGERVRDASDWAGRFAALDARLGSALDADDVPDEVRHAWELLNRSRGTLPVRDVAAAVGWSERHLSTRFATEVGLTPKPAARVIRFHHARRQLQTNVLAGRPDLAGVAASGGYFDQAHLVRDWRQFTGLAPTDWIAAEFRNFQAAPDMNRAGSGA